MICAFEHAQTNCMKKVYCYCVVHIILKRNSNSIWIQLHEELIWIIAFFFCLFVEYTNTCVTDVPMGSINLSSCMFDTISFSIKHRKHVNQYNHRCVIWSCLRIMVISIVAMNDVSYESADNGNHRQLNTKQNHIDGKDGDRWVSFPYKTACWMLSKFDCSF